MDETTAGQAGERLILYMRIGFWTALAIVAAMAIASLVYFDRMESLAGSLDAEAAAMHRNIFRATTALLLLAAVCIFRLLSKLIARKARELVEARNSMAFIAVHDGLTGLHNRAFLLNHFDTVLTAARRRRERFAVVQFDLDRFKQINDTLGHAAGDLVLARTAARMRDSCRASDLCVRLGGDEFVMVLGAVGTGEDIELVLKRILARINEPVEFGGATINPCASAGVAVYPVDGDSAGDLLVHADLALYCAKKLGGGSFSFFSDELRQELEHRKQLEGDLRRAVAEKAFTVHFQPQMSLADRTVTGVEALMRWHHPERGMIAPGDFIPVAEKSGLMPAIGRIVIAKAIHEAAGWHRAGLAFGRLAVNVSSSELREDGFSTFLFATLKQTGLPPEKLALEIVEPAMLDDDTTGIAGQLRAIRAAGVHLELDDFGAGFALLAHVNPNEIDRLKIDRRFIENIDANGDNARIVRAIAGVARGLGIALIAEGAETEQELTSLMAIGCDQVQGFSVAFPMPEPQAREWLEAHGGKRKLTKVQERKRA